MKFLYLRPAGRLESLCRDR